MGNMRQIIRGIAQVHADPALMLNAADRALRLEHPDKFVRPVGVSPRPHHVRLTTLRDARTRRDRLVG